MVCGCTHEQELHDQEEYECKVKGCGCCQFITDVEEWKRMKERWDWEDAEDNRMWAEVRRQEQAEREDNEPPSGSTDLGNPGGTKFCY